MTSRRRLEWTFCGAADSYNALSAALDQTSAVMWTELRSQLSVQDMEEAPGWYAPILWFRLNGEYHCCVDGLLLGDKYWVYQVQCLDAEGEWYHDERIAVRAIPTGLVINCSLRIVQDAHFEALFTALSGQELLREEHSPLPPVLKVSFLKELLRERLGNHSAVQKPEPGTSRSPECSADFLDDDAVLWNRSLSNGVLQRH